MEFPFTKEEVRILKRICENPIFKESQPLHIEKKTTLKKIRLDICNYYNIKEEEFLSQRRDATLIKARREFCHHASKIIRADTSIIAKAMNRECGMVYNHLKKPSPETDKLLQSINDSKDE
jgi:chromosomal replication initiation ATPase DnaA|tara:strand:+ start:898 stop:1260 length:363 start_codon:yes stop_codon:yes gene_type:complete